MAIEHRTINISNLQASIIKKLNMYILPYDGDVVDINDRHIILSYIKWLKLLTINCRIGGDQNRVEIYKDDMNSYFKVL